MTPDDIRALYAETLADWFGKRQGCETENCTGCRDAGRQATAALAEAGLLPTIEEFEHFKTATIPGVVRARRFVTDWRVTE